MAMKGYLEPERAVAAIDAPDKLRLTRTEGEAI
jgi:hypothetical protein